MKSDIHKYLNALYLDEKRYDIAQDAKNFLCSRDIDFLSSNKQQVAELFFQILISFQLAYDENTEEIQKETIVLFKHIALINTATETQSMDGNLITIWFLNELYQKKEVDINSEIMKNNLKSIISGFSGISYVFKIEKDGKKVFPISNLIAKVIQNHDFKSMESITPYHVKIFQLAVELFEDQEKQDVLDKLKEDCNLEFIDYLDGNQKIIDTNDFMNYQKNGVMIFYNSRKKSFLIRHTDKSYFTITDRSNPCEINEERNANGDAIGYYAVIEVGEAELVDYKSVIKDFTLEILTLIYDKHYYNIFHEKALYKVGQKIHPVNIFAENDDNIISDRKNGKSESYKKEDIRNIINRYRMMEIKRHSIDMVTFGLCQSLLEYYNTGTAVFKFNDDCNDWKQNIIIRNWINEVPDKKGALSFVLKKYCTELEYCQNRISDYNITIQDLMPLYSNIDWAYEILGLSYNDCAIYKGTVNIDDDYEPYININNNDTIAGMTNPKNSPIYLNSCGFYNDLSDQDKQKYRDKGVEHYIIYNKPKDVWTASPEDESIYRYLARTEVLLKKNSLSYEMCKLVEINSYNDIKSCMKLHEDALMLNGQNSPFVHFDSMVAYRLIHNLINYKINPSNWTSFKSVIDHHHKLDFQDIDNNEVFKKEERGVLYVPKDRLGKDGVFHDVYESMRDKCTRDNNNIYDPNITTYNGKYFINGQVIKKIVFLFDNICVGTATCNTVAFYIGQEELVTNNKWTEKKINVLRDSLQKYTIEGQIVTVADIIKINNITNIEVYSCYTTEQGKEKVENMLAGAGYESATVEYAQKIDRWSKAIKDDLIKLKFIKEDKFTNICTIIRKFNQPKKNVFPNEMLDDAGKAICLFVKKPELYIS